MNPDSTSTTTSTATKNTLFDVPEIIRSWTEAKLNGATLDAESMAILVTKETADDPALANWVRANTTVTKSEFQRAVRTRLRNDRIAAELGVVPSTPGELVDAYVKREGITVFYNGVIHRRAMPYIQDPDGTRHVITPEDRANNELVDWHARLFFEGDIPQSNLCLKVRRLVAELKMEFRRDDIGDAVDDWVSIAKAKRIDDLIGEVGLFPLEMHRRRAAEDAWKALIAAAFDTSETSPSFVAAVLATFMWQVKRKMRSLPITDHLMPVLLGPQGVGKSTFVHAMLTPIREGVLEVDFTMIADDRNIAIWDSLVLFLDEMGYAARTDIETIKHVITANSLTRRVMRSNSADSVKQKATFIGCSNKELEQLIRDPTGIRRFVGLRYSSTPDWDVVNATDWKLLWQSVDADAPHPMIEHKGALIAMQAETRTVSRVEHWLSLFNRKTDVDVDGDKYADVCNTRGRISVPALYRFFRRFEDYNYPGSTKTSLNDWTHELKRLRKATPGVVPFTRVREASGWHYAYLEGVEAEQRRPTLHLV